MKTANKVLMAQARESLKGKWGLAVGTLFLYMVISMAIGMIPGIGSFIGIFITGAFMFGICSFSLSISRGKDAHVGQLFDGFHHYGKTLGTYLLFCLMMLLWALPLIIGMFIFVFAGIATLGSGMDTVSPFLFLLSFVLMIPVLIAGLMYSQAFFILADNPQIKAMDALRQSKKMMDGNKWKLFCLGLRFIGWMILAIIPFGLGLLWFMPYLEISRAKFYEDVKKNFNGSSGPTQMPGTPTAPVTVTDTTTVTQTTTTTAPVTAQI